MMGYHINNGRLSDIIGVYIYIYVCFFQKNGYMVYININHYSDVGFVYVFFFCNHEQARLKGFINNLNLSCKCK